MIYKPSHSPEHSQRWFAGPFRALAPFAAVVLFCGVTDSRAADNTTLLNKAKTTAFLGVQLQNDNEGLEPTTDAERARMKQVEDMFKSKLESSGRFKFVTVPPEMLKEISVGQNIGECHGCEVEYGRKLHAELIAWIKVQKVSNLILNMNVYMADVQSQKMTFVHSVDIRGNTDESWTRSLTYLVNNYLLTKSGL